MGRVNIRKKTFGDEKNLSCHMHDHSYGSFRAEILAHFPYAVLSVSFTLIVVGIFYSLGFFTDNVKNNHNLFHIFHYLHLLFAGTGTVLTFRRFSKSFLGIFIAGMLIPAFFCTISDAVLPYLGGLTLGLSMKFHWCFISHLDMVLPFLFTGIANGWALSVYSSEKHLVYSTRFHFLHIFASAMASLLYMQGFGFSDWMSNIGIIFLFLIFVVLIPCSLSDIVIPLWFAKKRSIGVLK